MNDRSGKQTNARDVLLPALRSQREGNRPGRLVLTEVHLNRGRLAVVVVNHEFRQASLPNFVWVFLCVSILECLAFYSNKPGKVSGAGLCGRRTEYRRARTGEFESNRVR